MIESDSHHLVPIFEPNDWNLTPSQNMNLNCMSWNICSSDLASERGTPHFFSALVSSSSKCNKSPMLSALIATTQQAQQRSPRGIINRNALLHKEPGGDNANGYNLIRQALWNLYDNKHMQSLEVYAGNMWDKRNTCHLAHINCNANISLLLVPSLEYEWNYTLLLQREVLLLLSQEDFICGKCRIRSGQVLWMIFNWYICVIAVKSDIILM